MICSPGVDADTELPAMVELAKFEPIDEVRHRFGIIKEQLGMPRAYLGKGLSEHPEFVEIVDEYLEWVHGIPGFKQFLKDHDYVPQVKVEKADIELNQQIEAANKEAAASEGAKQAMAQQTGLPMEALETMLKFLFPNGIPNAEALAKFQQGNDQIAQANILASGATLRPGEPNPAGVGEEGTAEEQKGAVPTQGGQPAGKDTG